MKLLAGLVAVAIGCGATVKAIQLVVTGDARTVRKRPPNIRPSSPDSTQILFIAFDGVSRDSLYELLRAGKLPNLRELVGGDNLAHAYLDETFLSNLPSTTMPAWVSAQSGHGAAEHGVPGNEYFIRERLEFACPAPVSFKDSAPTLSIYTDDYLNRLVAVPSVYEQIHLHDPEALIWVGMNHFFRGTDKLVMADRQAIAGALEGFIETQVEKLEGDTSRKLYENLDKAGIDAIASRLDDKTAIPDVITLYISGADLYAHVAEEGPDKARSTYLTEVIDPALGTLLQRLRERRALDNRWIIVSSDHGHTQIVKDTTHAISTKDDSAPGVLMKAGFRLRPFKRAVDKQAPFSAVLAYGGAMAYVYLADRSKCPTPESPCSWGEPPRYREDVLAAAEAFYTNNRDGALVPGMKGKLDMIFVREPRPVLEKDLPFEVYVGGGKSMPIDDYLRAHPHPNYVAVAERMKELAVGTHGERAGDILLLANNGNRDKPEDRYYFAEPYRSWHGSPSKGDSEIPLIVAHRGHRKQAIGAFVKPILGDKPFQRKITDIMMKLRKSPPR
ncbi:MAG: alkaline phosphatase family protein [Deltaproteobacteria bacterium]|nr:alkaline phosphatase family protein [Deltaproteobacteria bacterium]